MEKAPPKESKHEPPPTPTSKRHQDQTQRRSAATTSGRGATATAAGDRAGAETGAAARRHPVTLTGPMIPQNSSVINMSVMAMATVLIRMARPVARPTPSGPPDAVIP